jgi:hypothetical protein
MPNATVADADFGQKALNLQSSMKNPQSIINDAINNHQFRIQDWPAPTRGGTAP